MKNKKIVEKKDEKKETIEKHIDKEMTRVKETVHAQEDFKKWVEGKFNEIIKFFLVDFVSLNFAYVDGPPARNGDGHVIFTVAASDKYHQMNVNVFPSAFDMSQQGKKEQLIDGIVHECAHIHTDRLSKIAEDRFVTRSQVMDANEHLTEVIAEYVRRTIKKDAPQIYNNK